MNKYSVLFVIFLLDAIRNVDMDKSSKCSKQLPSKFYHTNNVDICIFSHFTKFTDLILACNQTYYTTKQIRFVPEHRLLVDKTIQLTKLMDARHLNNIDFLAFINIKGFDLNYHEFSSNYRSTPVQFSKLYVSYSEFGIYLHGNLTRGCDLQTYTHIYTLMFATKSLYLCQVIYPPSICPLVFTNSSISSLFFNDITNSLLVKNRLTFFDLSSQTKPTLDVDFKKLVLLSFDVYFEKVTRRLINPQLFKSARSLMFTGRLDTVDNEIFDIVTNLKQFTLKISNLREFLHKNSHIWAHLNTNVHAKLEISLANVNKICYARFITTHNSMSFEREYAYPDEDLCLFKDFPHKRLVVPKIYQGRKINCSCTLRWLFTLYLDYKIVRDDSGYDEPIDEKQPHILTSTYEYCKQEFRGLKCDLASKLINCRISSVKQYSEHFVDDIGLFFLFKWLQYVLLLIIQPFLCLISIVNNIGVILVISNKTKSKLFKDKMYSYIRVNALFNIFYCLVSILKLMSVCVFFYAPYTCSPMYQTDFSQRFKIIVVFFLGNVFQMCANISYVSFAFVRLVAISVKKSYLFYSAFTRMNIRVYFCLLVLLSSLLSLFILFQYDLNSVNDYRKEFPYEKRDEFFCELIKNKYACRLFNGFKLANQMLNGILFVCLNFVIDLCLVRVFNREINAKMEIHKHKEERKS